MPRRRPGRRWSWRGRGRAGKTSWLALTGGGGGTSMKKKGPGGDHALIDIFAGHFSPPRLLTLLAAKKINYVTLLLLLLFRALEGKVHDGLSTEYVWYCIFPLTTFPLPAWSRQQRESALGIETRNLLCRFINLFPI